MKRLFFFLPLLSIFSCQKGSIRDDTSPSLAFKSASIMYKQSSLDSTSLVSYCTVTLSFTDESGDIGWSSDEQAQVFPQMPIAPLTSYANADTTEVYIELNKYYIATQKAFYSAHFPEEQYDVFDDESTYPVLMKKYEQLVELYERIMQKEYYCLLVEYFEGENSKQWRKDVNYNSVLPPLGGYVPGGSMATGDIVYDINISERHNDTVSFSFILRDRKKNTSEKVYTLFFVIPKK